MGAHDEAAVIAAIDAYLDSCPPVRGDLDDSGLAAAGTVDVTNAEREASGVLRSSRMDPPEYGDDTSSSFILSLRNLLLAAL